MANVDLKPVREQTQSIIGAYAASIVEHAQDALLLTAPDGRVLASNAAARHLLDRTDAEIRAVGRSGIAVMNEAAADFLRERERTGRARGVLTLRRRDGSTFLADVASTVFSGPRGEKWTSMSFRDVTDAERARHALEVLADAGGVLDRSLDPRETLRNLTDLVVPNLADACTVDLLEGGGVTRVAVAHRDPDRAAAFAEVRQRQLHPSTFAGVDFVLRTGRPSCMFELTDEWLRSAAADEAHLVTARGLGVQSFISVPLEVRAKTIGALSLMSDGGVPSFRESDLSLVRALAERAAIALDNARRHEETLEARRLRDEVLAVVAHDLRAPLTVIQLAAGHLASEGVSKLTEMILRAASRANALVEDLLLAAKSDAGALPLDCRFEAIRSVIHEVHSLYAPIASAREVDFVLVVSDPGDLDYAEIDRHRVVQMLSNIVANAIDITPSSGRVELRARGEAELLVFEIVDTGPGIASEDLPHVFDRFWQGARRRKVGAGIGLTIAHAVAVSHGGSIAVESEPGQGACFRVVLPRRVP